MTTGAASETVMATGGPRLLAALCVATFLAALNFFAATPFYPDIAHDLDTTVPLLGQATTVMILVSAALGLVIGPIADRYGYRLPLTIGMVAITLALICMALAPSYPVLLVIGLLGGLGDALVFNLPLALASIHFAGVARGRAIGLVLASLSAAPVLGLPVLTALGGHSGWRAAIFAAGICSALSSVFVAIAIPVDRRGHALTWSRAELFRPYGALLHHRPTLALYGCAGLRAVTWFGVLTYTGAFAREELGLGVRQAALIYTIVGVATAAGGVLGGRLQVRSPRAVVAATSAICAGGVAAMFVSSHVVAATGFAVLGGSASAMAGVAITTLLAAESPAGPGTTMTLNGSVLNLGAAIGAAIGGLLIAGGGYGALGIGLPAFALVGAVLALWRPKRA